MALETATYISDLVSTNPTSSDNISDGDNHIRLLKSTVKATFPYVSGAITPTHTELNKLAGLTTSAVELGYVAGATSSLQTQLNAKSATGHTHTAADVTDFAEVVQDTVGTMVTDSSTIDFTYDDTAATLTGSIKDTSVTLAMLAAAVSSTLVPSGTVAPYAGTSSPTGWLMASGQAVSRTTYAALFAIVGSTYGSGDGSTTFNLPDLRGRVIAGLDSMGGTSANRLTGLSGGVDGDVLGGVGGAESHTLTEAQMPSHYHLDGFAEPAAGSYGSTTGPSVNNMSFSGSSTSHPRTSSTGGGAAHNIVQPTFILNYIIKT